MNRAPDVMRLLRRLRRRVTAQLLLGGAARAALAVAALLVLLAAGAMWITPDLWRWSIAAPLAGVVMLSGVLLAWRKQPSIEHTAAGVDRAANTRDRFTTVLDFGEASKSANPADLRRVASAECARYLLQTDFSPHLAWRLPRELRWIGVPLLALALLRWQSGFMAAQQAASATAAAAAVAPTVAGLKKLAVEAKAGAEETGNEDLKRVAEELQRSAERLRAEAEKSGEADKSTLSSLSALQDLVRALQERRRAQLSPAELKELAQALHEMRQTEEAAAALDRGDLPGAAQKLEDAAKSLSKKDDPAEAQQVENALRSALDRLAQQRQLSEALQKLRQQLGSGATSKLMQQLAQALRNMPAQSGSGAGQTGAPASAADLQKLLSALDALKQGEGMPKQKDSGEGKGDPGQLLARIGQHQGGKDEPQLQLPNPTGQPGSEHDLGTTESPFDQRPHESNAKAGEELALRGKPGEGKTASQVLPGAVADDSRARREYKALYDAMAPAAEDAVMQENIPLGSRFFVRRYFEAIRPKE